MALPETRTLELELDAGVLRVTLARPEVRNALSLEMAGELRAVLTAVAADRGVRAIVVRGAGGAFCAGGDVKDMRTLLTAPESQRRRRTENLSRAFGELLLELDAAPQVVIAAVEGAAMGGGLGLVAASDVALATADARFALPETTLGLVPAQIAPFVARRIGLPQTRRLSLTGAAFDAHEARELGLVHHLCADAGALDAKLGEILGGVLRCAPGAVASTKALLGALESLDAERLLERASRVFADALLGDEGREGTRARMEKRRPRWSPGAP